MDAFFRSLAVAVLLSGTQICAAEISAPNQKVIIVEREGQEVAATTDDKPAAAAKESKEQPAEIFFLTTEPASATHYWIGLEANPLGKPGRAKLKVDADFGLLVEHVRPASPADKAGLKANDVLLKAGDKPLRQTADLAAAIQESKGSDLKLEIERDGKLQKIVVQPAQRPALKAKDKILDQDSEFAWRNPPTARRNGRPPRTSCGKRTLVSSPPCSKPDRWKPSGPARRWFASARRRSWRSAARCSNSVKL